MPTQERIQARSLMWAIDYVKAMNTSLERGITVTRFVLGYPDEGPIEFELVVTKIANHRVPRTTSAPAAKKGAT